jgi:hypothetical protein
VVAVAGEVVDRHRASGNAALISASISFAGIAMPLGPS